MWELLPTKVKYWIGIGGAIFLFVIFEKLLGQSFLRAISYTITTMTILAWLFGKYLWRYVYFDILKRKFCPDFNGEWVGKISSNFGGGTTVEFPIKIEADFFNVKMLGSTTLGRTYANYCKIVRTEDGCFELEYMFKGINDTPSETDATFYEGAARLRVIDISTMNMKGVYWTNRCWQQSKNTAGVIELVKKCIDI
ncbi:hypothetical protein [Plesiomonas shigelloides]|uniref:hypothetical protein n=1 Tax=Plesiomonas shigelloides TaxID=703 RepID=UPI0031B74904